MSREIKFRGQKIGNRKWVNGYIARIQESDDIGNVKSYYFNVLDEMGWKYECSVYADTVGQYIGVKDKNGKEIYEGDIVLSDDGKIGQVQWFEEHSAFMIWCVTDNKVYFLYDNDFSKIEVIGNMYENADLLEDEENE